MRCNHLDQPLSKALPLRLGKNENVRQISKRRPVGYHSREAKLLVVLVNSEWHRVRNRALDSFAGYAFRPVRRRQILMNGGHIYPRRITADRKPIARPFAYQNTS